LDELRVELPGGGLLQGDDELATSDRTISSSLPLFFEDPEGAAVSFVTRLFMPPPSPPRPPAGDDVIDDDVMF
jgi:hypothetical protein